MGLQSLIFLTMVALAQAQRHQAVERLLEVEKDPVLRAQLVIKWFHLRLESMKPEDEIEVYGRLIAEEDGLRERAGSAAQEINRVLAWHFFKKKNFAEAIKHFERLKTLHCRDSLAYGDSLMQQGLLAVAIEEYQKALSTMESSAAYRLGWVYLQLDDFEQALKYFDRSLASGETADFEMKKAAFRERIIPWIQLRSSDDLSEFELKSLEAKAVEYFGSESLLVFREVLEKAIDASLSRNFLESAELISRLLAERFPDSAYGLAARWLRTYRARLMNDKILNLLGTITLNSSQPLPSELAEESLKTIEAFEKSHETLAEGAVSSQDLLRLYSEALRLFPQDSRFDRTRINDAKLAFDRRDYQACEGRLGFQSSDELLERDRKLLLSRCKLLKLDYWLAQANTSEAFPLLQELFVQDRIYLQFPENEREGLRDSLGQSLLGLVGGVEASRALEVLKLLEAHSPWPAEHKFRQEVSLARERLQLRILSSQEKTTPQTQAFLSLAQTATSEEVQSKAAANAALLDDGELRLQACFELLKKKNPEEAVRVRCREAFRQALELAALKDWILLFPQRDERERFELAAIDFAMQGKVNLEHSQEFNVLKALGSIERPKDSAGALRLPETWKAEVTASDRKSPTEAIQKRLSQMSQYEKNLTAKHPTEVLRVRYEMSAIFHEWLKSLKDGASSREKDFEEGMSSLIKIWESQENERKLAYCKALEQDDPFAHSTHCPSHKWAVADLQKQILFENPQPAVELSAKEYEVLTQVRAQKNPAFKRFTRIYLLGTEASQELRAIILRDWAIEEKRGDWLKLAMAMKPRSRSFYAIENVEGLNSFTRKIFEEALKRLSQETIADSHL